MIRSTRQKMHSPWRWENVPHLTAATDYGELTLPQTADYRYTQWRRKTQTLLASGLSDTSKCSLRKL